MRVGAIIENSTQDLPSRATVGVTMRMGRSLHLIGTGLLITLYGHAFVITAAHVVKRCHKYEGELGLVSAEGHFVPLNEKWLFSPLRNYGTACDPIDVAAQRIHALGQEQLPEQMFLNLDCMELAIDTCCQKYYLYGFPFSLVKRGGPDGSGLVLRPWKVFFRPYSGATDMMGNYWEQFHLLLDARRGQIRSLIHHSTSSLPSRNNPPLLTPGIECISGSGIWTRDEQDKHRIVGLQTGVYYRRQVIKATRWALVMRVLNDFFPDIAGVH